MNEEMQAPNAVADEYIDNLAARVKEIVALTAPFAQEALGAIRSMRAGKPNAGTGELGVSFEAATRLVRQQPLVVLGVTAACVLGTYAMVRRKARPT